MVKILFTYIVSTLCLLALWVPASAVDPPITLLKQGLEKFRAGEYESALVFFDRSTGMEKNNPHIDAGLYLVAKTNIRLKRFKNAQTTIENLHTRFPQSLYIPYANLLMAEVLYAQKKDAPAYQLLLKLLSPDTPAPLRKYTESKLKILFEPLSLRQLRDLRNDCDENGRQFINQILRKRSGEGCFIVLIAEEDKSAELILSGIKSAFNTNSPWLPVKNPPALEVITLGDDILQNYLRIKDLTYEPVKCIISLLPGDQSRTAVMAGSWIEAPFFVVKDDSPDLWRLGENIWQLSPDKLTLGRELADFAFKSLKVNRFATISALDDSRAKFTEAFIERFEKEGGKVMAQDEDLGNNFKNLRSYGFRSGFEDSVKTLFDRKALVFRYNDHYRIPKALKVPLDEERFTVKNLNEDLLNSLWNDYRAIERDKANLQGIQIDSSDITLNTYQGFLFPLKEEEVDMFISQFAFYNFQTKLFTFLSAFPRLTIDRKIPSTSEIYLVGWGRLERTGAIFASFVDYFYRLKNIAPYDEEVLGFDTANFALGFEDLCELNKGGTLKFKGIFYDFEFPPSDRCNCRVDFYRLEKSDFVYVTQP
jgi:hypothetical protein